MQENFPTLISSKPLSSEFENLQKIPITSENFTLGRALTNSACIPYLSISRKHCSLRKTNNDWILEDHSSFGIEVNGKRIGKGKTEVLTSKDLIKLEPSEEFVYQFIAENEDYEVPRKRIKLEPDSDDEFINNVKLKFEESQRHEIRHMEEKLQNTKQMQTTTAILKKQLQVDMNRKIEQLQSEFAVQIKNLQGEKNEVECQKALLIEERDAQLQSIREEMEGKILELMEQIHQHNESESELLKENNSLKEKLAKEREEFLAELHRESSSKEDMLRKLESNIKEQEEVRLREKEELRERLQEETKQLRLAKEKELKELAEQKSLREKELIEELDNIKKNLEEQVQQTEQQRLQTEQQLNEQMEQMRKLSDEDRVKMELLEKEREEIQKKLNEAESNAKASLNDLQKRVQDRETELAALAAERIQKQAEQSSEVITSLQEQLEKVKSQLNSVELEKNELLVNLPDAAGEGPSNQSTLAQFGELMESELQCSICAELFVEAITLNCSHTFCKYCITMWKKKKKDCPICRTGITSECKSLVLDSFIEKMVQNLTDELKKKREEMLRSREELQRDVDRQNSARANRGSDSFDDVSDASYSSAGPEEEYSEEEPDEYYNPFSDDVLGLDEDDSERSGSDTDTTDPTGSESRSQTSDHIYASSNHTGADDEPSVDGDAEFQRSGSESRSQTSDHIYASSNHTGADDEPSVDGDAEFQRPGSESRSQTSDHIYASSNHTGADDEPSVDGDSEFQRSGTDSPRELVSNASLVDASHDSNRSHSNASNASFYDAGSDPDTQYYEEPSEHSDSGHLSDYYGSNGYFEDPGEEAEWEAYVTNEHNNDAGADDDADAHSFGNITPEHGGPDGEWDTAASGDDEYTGVEGEWDAGGSDDGDNTDSGHRSDGVSSADDDVPDYPEPESSGRRRRGTVPGVPGAYYGGYGRCFSCGARGHWAPGCPLR